MVERQQSIIHMAEYARVYSNGVSPRELHVSRHTVDNIPFQSTNNHPHGQSRRGLSDFAYHPARMAVPDAVLAGLRD